MRDFLGNKVSEGDYIFYSATGRWPEPRLCKIVRFTPKSIIVNVIKTNRPSSIPKGDIVVRNDFVKVNYQETSDVHG